MIFLADGPDIPADILAAREEGRLVLVCGAGISMPQMPSFEGLVDRVLAELGVEPTEIEKVEKHQQNYDRVLGLLEGEGRFSSALVRRAVARILRVPVDPVVGTHEAILDLSRDREGKIRLVTTNFDHLFEHADPNIRWTAAPFLPVPKREKWNGVVYLHGRIDEEADPDGQHLVLTSADFGVALASGYRIGVILFACHSASTFAFGLTPQPTKAYAFPIWLPRRRSAVTS